MRISFMWLYSNVMLNICLSVAYDTKLFDTQIVQIVYIETFLRATVEQVSVLYKWRWLENKEYKR